MNYPKAKKYSNACFIVLFFCASAFIVTFPLIFRMTSGIYGSFFETDIRGGLWSLWWQKYAFVHHLDDNFCGFLSAPFGVDLNQSILFWIPSLLLKCFTFITSPIFCLNLLTLISFVSAGYFTYLLAYRLTGNLAASIFSGFIFTFSPFHLNKVMEFTFFSEGNWVVLYVFGLLKLKEKPGIKQTIFAGVAFGLLLNFNAYYGLFSFVFTLGLFIFCFSYQWKNKFIALRMLKNRVNLSKRFFSGLHFIVSMACVFLIALAINVPTLIKFFNNALSLNSRTIEKSVLGYVRSFDYLIAQSARPLSYLMPASTHPVFGGFTKAMFGSIFYGRGSIEQTLYLGWMPLILSFIAFRVWKKRRLDQKEYPGYASSDENFTIGFFIFSAWLAFVCSLPPYIDLGFFKIYLPSYYFYKILPMFRAYARFGIIVSLCVSVLAAYGLKYTLEKIKSGKIKILWTVFVFSAILFEFSNVPPWRVADLTNVPAVYSWLAREKGDFIVAEYPMAKAVPGEAPENYDYLYYQTIHQKRLVNGAPLNAEAAAIKEKIFKVDSPQTPAILKTLGVAYLILHSRLYKNGEYTLEGEIVGEIPQLEKVKGYKLVQAFGDDLVYEVIGEGE